MAASNYSLKVNRDLLDPNFESYRLSLDAIPTYNVELDAGERNLGFTVSKRARLALETRYHFFHVTWSFLHFVNN